MIDKTFFSGNRATLRSQLKPGGALVLTAHSAMQKVGDQEYPFVQESNFWYLTGIEEAGWLLVIDSDSGDEYLVAPKLAHFQEVFNGSLAHDEARVISGVDKILEQKAGRALLKDLLAKKERVYTLMPEPRKVYGVYSNPAQRDLLRLLKGSQLEDIRLTLARQRAIKQPVEIGAMQRAVDVTVEGLKATLKQLPSFTNEAEFAALITYEFNKRGATHAYEPIVASGKNACTLHYGKNNSQLTNGSLLLFDIGARVDGYCADISRTVAIGQPSARAQAVFDAVKRIQAGVIALTTDGRTIKDYFENMTDLFFDELVALGLLTKKDKKTSIYRWMPHAIGHGLGIDVHEALGRPEQLKTGMYLTVEPGIYIPDEGIGVRIEDDIIITKKGPRVLSAALPIKLL